MTKNNQTGKPIRDDHKTKPRGMASDSAHAPKSVSVGRRETETEESFHNSPQNAQSRQTEHQK